MHIKIECAHAAVVALADLKPNPRNPNKHPDSQLALLGKNIKALGWRHPVIVSKRSGLIVAGHARLAAARLIGADVVPVDYQDFASDAEETTYLIADNRIAELAELDNAAIKDLLQELDTGDGDMDLTGYTVADIEQLMTCDTPMKPVDIKKPPRMAWVLVGVPIGEWARVAALAEAAAKIEGSIVETTVNDGIKED
ncbi:MAG: ParB/Srx family N-terminal domain-containing protein [Kiritimatiellia bacterium]